ncbi:MAG: NADP-dependent oxidoreductase [Pseudomonadales bacterium]|nr:NADP-dependent oxidoreductase [Pseudomonadales bacterium]MBO6563803.1 NADP-dependent oxidoreductase [Pseudomonadales bacterium]MBO6595709.1 NADP-dependent oxidoreductase [Pseudomonadales bacterium]MBO6820733.1 NADP-dependent oxidoreductase [Pseudomonadales bacterium]
MSAGVNERTNEQLYLKQVPEGIAGPDDFEVRKAGVPVLHEGEVLVESHYFGLDAALRLIVRDSDEFLFRVRPGDLVRGTAAGKVIESNHPDYAVGEYVIASSGVQSYSVCTAAELEKCDVSQVPLYDWLGGFGVSGLTAYFAIFDECKPQPGQTVLINGAAGAVGNMAGQFCKLAGARVIGLTGSKEKCTWLVDELGFDVAIDYKDDDWYAQLEKAAPDRLDVIFDNVGGDILDESLKLIGMRGVVLLCGSTSQYVADEMTGPNNYIWLGTMRARMQGFVVFDYADQYVEARKRMAEWIADGRIKLPNYFYEGSVAAFPAAFQELYEGKNLGKMLLKLAAAEN